MENVFEDYIKTVTERMAKQPEMMRSNDYRHGHRFIILKDEPKNIEKFNNFIKDINLPDDIIIYYNEPYYYDLIIDGINTRDKIEKERKRQRELEKPTVDLDINNKDELIDYILEELYDLEHSLVYEYSSDIELDEVKLNAKHAKLLELVKKYL